VIRINAQYTDYYDNTDPAYPGGKAIDASTPNDEDGTPVKADWFNDIGGFLQAVIVDALGAFLVSGVPDRAGASDVLNALKIIIRRLIANDITAQKVLSLLLTVDGAGSGLDADLFGGYPPEYYKAAASAGFFVKAISGEETVIPWTEFGMEYAPEKVLAVFISAHGFYKEFVSFPYDTREDGLHVFPQRLIDGKLVPGTRMKKWGIGKWGEGSVYVPGRKWGTFQWGAENWSASRTVGGTTWGGCEPMKINIQIKEA
jgi:hypothetical protein